MPPRAKHTGGDGVRWPVVSFALRGWGSPGCNTEKFNRGQSACRTGTVDPSPANEAMGRLKCFEGHPERLPCALLVVPWHSTWFPSVSPSLTELCPARGVDLRWHDLRDPFSLAERTHA